MTSQGGSDPELYFAYGSNLDEAQLRARCPSATFVGTATLPGHRLVFSGESITWQHGGTASVVVAPDASVEGAIFAMSSDDLRKLDRHEGHPRSYMREPLPVRRASVDEERAWVYRRATDAAPRPPSPEYLAKVQAGYARFGIDARPLLEAVEAARRSA